MTMSLHEAKYKAIISRLIQERERASVSQENLATRLQTTQSTVSKIERLERRLDISEFITLCEALQISPSNLIREFERFAKRKPKP